MCTVSDMSLFSMNLLTLRKDEAQSQTPAHVIQNVVHAQCKIVIDDVGGHFSSYRKIVTTQREGRER